MNRLGFVAIPNILQLNMKMIYNDKFLNLIGLFFMLCHLVLPFYFRRELTQFVHDRIKEPTNIRLWVPITVTQITYFVSNGLYLIPYLLEMPFFEQYKVYKNKAWPWKTNKKYWRQVLKCVLTFSFNNYVTTPILGYLSFGYMGYAPGITVEDLPSSYITFLAHICLMMFIDDAWFYCSHRLLHTKWLYKHVHSWHHELHHSNVLGGDYSHPFEYLIGNILPSVAGLLLLGKNTHVFTYCIYISYRITEGVEAHGGYEFPWTMTHWLPFGCSVDHHDHHHRVNKGNFGSFFIIWDTLCGTNQPYYKELNREEEKEAVKTKAK